MTTLIDRLNERAHDPERATDERQEAASVAAPPATEAELAAAERELVFALPPLLRRVYREVGNGGFGPGFGLHGLSAPDADASLVGRYGALRRSRAVPAWPAGLIPLCEWGSGIVSCLDCSRPEAPVVRVDPNMAKGDVAARVPAAMHFDKAKQVGNACWVEAPSLEAWLEAWADGKSLFYLGYGAPDEEGDEDEEEEGGEDE